MQTATRETLKQFETRLLAVERSTSLDMPFPEFFELVLKALHSVGEIASVTVWLYTHGVSERVISTGDNSEAPAIPTEVRADTTAGRVSTEQEFSGNSEPIWCCRSFEDISRAFKVCLEVRLRIDPSENYLLGEATLALSECLASWFRRSLIARMDEKLETQTFLTEFCHKTYPWLQDPDFGFVAASEIRWLLKVDRICLLRVGAGKCEIAGISGCDRLDRSLEVPRALHRLSEVLFDRKLRQLPGWLSLRDGGCPIPELSEETIAIITEGGTTQVRGFIVKADGGADREWRILAELFGETKPPAESHWSSCRDQIAQVLSKAEPSGRSKFGYLKRLGKLWVFFVSLAVLICAGMFPVDFEIDAAGTLVPTSERRIFAPGSGIIQDLTVRHGSAVQAGHTLLRIHSPELALKIQEVLGLLETERVRLSSLQRTRLSADGGPPGRDAVEQALGGEQAVRQRITDLESRLQLLKTQQERLVISTEFSGRVYRRNLELDLQTRPVQQGDFLFTLIADDSAWQLELDVDEHLLGYLRPSSGDGPSNAPVRFRFLAEPELRLTAAITGFGDSVVQENGRSNAVAFAAVSQESVLSVEKHRQPGTTVAARIYCGRRAAGFVLFRELAEFVREKSFSWL